MPSNSVILENAPAACVLAGADIAKGGMYSLRIDPLIDQKIYATYKVIKKIYDIDPSYENMTPYCQYLWELMGRWGIAAMDYTGTGGQIAGITPGSSSSGIFPFIITSADFEADGVSYNNADIVGVNLSIFINEYSQQWLQASGTTFTGTATGIQILIPGFDANVDTYTIMIQKLNS